MKGQTIAWIQFEVEVEDDDGSVIRVNTVDKAFNSQMMEVFEGNDLGEVIDKMFAHMMT